MDDSDLPIKPTRVEIIPNAEDIVARVDKDAFRAMFYMFAGKPDSKHRVFERKVTVSPEDITDLNEQILEKFKLHNILQVITSASISLNNNETIEFGTWQEFLDNNWKTSSVIHDLSMQWDFLIKLPSHIAPQRHTLTVKFSGGTFPPQGLSFVIKVEGIGINLPTISSSCIARVDFINHALADELLALVGKWNSALPQPDSEDTFFVNLKTHDGLIARIIHYSLPLFSTLLLITVLWDLTSAPNLDAPVTLFQIRFIAVFTIISIAILSGTRRLGEMLAQSAYTAINQYGSHHTFRFTRGDTELQNKITRTNRKSVTTFILSVGLTLSLNIIAGVVTWYFLPKS